MRRPPTTKPRPIRRRAVNKPTSPESSKTTKAGGRLPSRPDTSATNVTPSPGEQFTRKELKEATRGRVHGLTRKDVGGLDAIIKQALDLGWITEKDGPLFERNKPAMIPIFSTRLEGDGGTVSPSLRLFPVCCSKRLLPFYRHFSGVSGRRGWTASPRPPYGPATPKEESNPKKPLVTQTITACPGQTGHPKSKITTATHTGQAVAPSGDTHVQATPAPTSGLRGHTHAVPDRASPQAT